MHAFIINLDSATDRWAFIQASFAGSQLVLCRVPAVDWKTLTLSHAQYSEKLYRWFHGRTPNVRELACYLSHLKAMEAFLATDEDHALIGEDDLVLRADFDAAIEGAMRYSALLEHPASHGTKSRPSREAGQAFGRLLTLCKLRPIERGGGLTLTPKFFLGY